MERLESLEDVDQLDPRIQVKMLCKKSNPFMNAKCFQIELEKLNSSTDVINKLELDLEEARSQFRRLLQESTRTLDQLSKELGPSFVERSR
jgi:hypothetical protein